MALLSVINEKGRLKKLTDLDKLVNLLDCRINDKNYSLLSLLLNNDSVIIPLKEN